MDIINIDDKNWEDINDSSDEEDSDEEMEEIKDLTKITNKSEYEKLKRENFFKDL